ITTSLPLFSSSQPSYFSTDLSSTEIYTLSLHDALPILLQRMPVHFISNGFIVPPREFRNEHRLVPILLGQEIVDCLFQYIFSTITQQYLRFINSVRFR